MRNYRKAFDNFDPLRRWLRYEPKKARELLRNSGIVRNRLKIESAIQNAKAFLLVQKEFRSFDLYVWNFVGGQTPGRTRGARSSELHADVHLPVRRHEART